MWDGPSFITQELAQAWIARRPTEALATQRNRAIVIRQLGLYQTRLDIESYVLPPRSLPPQEHYEPYIFCDQQLTDLFKQIDACRYCSWVPLRHRIMPLLFRLLYRCGLRLSEALHLRVRDVDLEQGVLRIMDGKFNNDWLPYPGIRGIDVLNITSWFITLVVRLHDFLGL